MYRKSKNIGDFKELKEPMQMKRVKKVARDAGVDLKGVKVKIDRSSDLLGRNLYGHAKGNKITLYPDAFQDTETLVKTLGHERIHIFQEKLFGSPTNSKMLNIFEAGAKASEEGWWAFYKMTTGGL